MKEANGCPWCARDPKIIAIRESWCFRVKFNCSKCQYVRVFDNHEESEDRAIESAISEWNKRELCFECEEDIREACVNENIAYHKRECDECHLHQQMLVRLKAIDGEIDNEVLQ